MTLSVELLLFIPAATALLCLFMPEGKAASIISAIGSLITLAAAIPLCYDAFTGDPVEYSLWYVDGLSALFVILISTVGFLVSLYSYGYIQRDLEEGNITSRDERHYFMLLQMFIAVMFLTCVVSSMGILWIAIEATTLVSAFLVGFYKKESSTEAAWKYLMICSVGITLGLIGITLVYASSINILSESPNSLDWPVLYSVAPQLDPAMMKMAFIFILVGFGTKMGLAPMHTWLPDAHSQAPTPISALLSAVLLNCALYSIIRFKMITDIAVPGFSMYLMIGFGILSMIVAAAFILISKNIKRMFAYSSIEHMGLIAIGLGIGTPIAVFGALYHVMAHSLTKPLLFFSAGNVIQEYGTTDMEKIKGMKEKMPFTSSMLMIGTLAIIGLPPFAIFVGELSILEGAFDASMYALAAAVIILLVIVFAGFVRNIFPMMNGSTDKEIKDPKGIMRALPMILLVLAILGFGLFMPEQLRNVFENIATLVSGGLL